MSVIIDCVNCGKEVIWEAGDDSCVWCRQSVRVKIPVVAVEKPAENMPLVPAYEVQAEIMPVHIKNTREVKEVKTDMSKGGDKHARHNYIEEHKAEIIADYLALGSQPARKKWEMSASGYLTILKRWAADIEAAKPGGAVVIKPLAQEVKTKPESPAKVKVETPPPPPPNYEYCRRSMTGTAWRFATY